MHGCTQYSKRMHNLAAVLASLATPLIGYITYFLRMINLVFFRKSLLNLTRKFHLALFCRALIL
jgi:uncharacterized membrane protein